MSRSRSWLLALALYTVVSLAYAWPLVSRFVTHLAGDGFDMYVFQWDNWWITHALCTGQNPYHTRMIFYPVGVALYFHSFSWLNTGVWWLLRGLVGDVAAYNFTVWWSWPLAGLGGYFLAREIADDRRAALVAGLIYAFYPYHFAQRNHLNLLSIQWVPFSLLFWIRATRRGRLRDGTLAGVFFALSGLAGWHLLTLSGMLAGLWLLYGWLTERRRWAGGNWRAVLAMVLVLAVLTGPLLAPIGWEWFVNPQGQDPYLGKEGETQTDLVAYFLPNLYHPLWGHLAAPIHGRFLRNKDHSVALGYLPLLLVLYGLARWRKVKEGRFWLIGLACFLILALGPFPRVNGVAYPQVPLPYRLIGWTPVVRSLRVPERFNILVGLCLAMVGGVAAKDLLHRLPWGLRGRVALILGTLILLEYWAWPFPTTPSDVPAFYHRLAAEPGDFAILEVPMGNDLSKLYMFYQTVHGRPTVTGHVSRRPEAAYAFIRVHQTLRSLWDERRPPSDRRLTADVDSFAGVGIRYIVVHRDRMGPGEWVAWVTYANIPPLVEEGDLVVYCLK